jgi:AcrR family transcriptional regulator
VPARPGRRSSSTSSTPAEILRATQELLLEHGIEGVSIRRLSDRCGFSAPTIYHHFGDKKGLIDALLEERFRLLYAVMESIPKTEPARHLRDMGQAYVTFALENPEHYQLLMQPGIRDADSVPSANAARALVRDDLEELARQGTLATDDLDQAFQLLWALLHGVISLQVGSPTGPVEPGLLDLAFDVVDAGLLLKGNESR